MKTFGSLKDMVLRKAGVRDHFKFNEISEAHRAFWEKLNRIEYDRGYVAGEYEKPGTPALCDMELLSEEEFQALLKEAKELATR